MTTKNKLQNILAILTCGVIPTLCTIFPIIRKSVSDSTPEVPIGPLLRLIPLWGKDAERSRGGGTELSECPPRSSHCPIGKGDESRREVSRKGGWGKAERSADADWLKSRGQRLPGDPAVREEEEVAPLQSVYAKCLFSLSLPSPPPFFSLFSLPSPPYLRLPPPPSLSPAFLLARSAWCGAAKGG